MSCEAVIIPALGLPFSMVTLPLLAARLAKSYYDEKQAQAAAAMREQRRKLSLWQDYQAGEQSAMERLNTARSEARSQLANLRLRAGDEDTSEGGDGDRSVKAHGFLDADVSTHSRAILAEIAEFLDKLPDALQADTNSPLQRLRAQQQQLAKQLESSAPPQLETLEAFQRAVTRSMEQWLEDSAQRQQRREQLLAQTEQLLSEALSYQALANTESQQTDMETLLQHLHTLLSQQKVSPAALDVLEKKFANLKTEIDEALEQAAIRHAIQSRIHANLQDMGYTLLQQENEMTSVWAVPGGERVKMVLQPNHQMAFQMQHEREHSLAQPLTATELAFMKQQEDRWCADLKTLVKRMIQEGFEYNVQFERDSSETEIPIVAVDSVEDIITATAQQPKSRTLDD